MILQHFALVVEERPLGLVVSVMAPRLQSVLKGESYGFFTAFKTPWCCALLPSSSAATLSPCHCLYPPTSSGTVSGMSQPYRQRWSPLCSSCYTVSVFIPRFTSSFPPLGGVYLLVFANNPSQNGGAYSDPSVCPGSEQIGTSYHHPPPPTTTLLRLLLLYTFSLSCYPLPSPSLFTTSFFF